VSVSVRPRARLFRRPTCCDAWWPAATFIQRFDPTHDELDSRNGRILTVADHRTEYLIVPALRRRFHKHLTFGPIATRATPEPALAHVFPNAAFSPDDLAALSRGPALMMSDLATAAQMIAIDTDAALSRDIVREILANASARQPTRTIGF
jgi:hypothetical protein